MLQNSIPDHPRLCSRKIRCRRWKLLPITFLTCHILHKPGQSISKFLKSDLCHFRYSFNTCSSSLSRFVGLDVRQTSWVLWVQTQRWHTTLMKRNLHPNVAASLSSIRTLVTSWVSHELKLWVQCRVTVWMQTRKRSEDAHDNFASRKKKPISKLFFKYLFATGASTSWFFFLFSHLLCHLFLQGHPLPCKPQDEHEQELACSPSSSHTSPIVAPSAVLSSWNSPNIPGRSVDQEFIKN